MRLLLACVLLAACTDAADVPTTVSHVHVTATCTMASATDCSTYSDVFNDDCGPDSATVVTPSTQELTVLTPYDAKDIAGYVQLQYTSDELSTGAHEEAHTDQVLKDTEKVEVYAAYDYSLLYRITPAGEVIDVDPSKLTVSNGNTLQFMYPVDGASIVEDHVIDAPRPVHVETDDPGIMDACCAVGRPQDAGIVLLALGFGLRARRRR